MDLITLLKVILLGIVEGVTEWLPISSTGHMILFNELIRLDVSDAFWEMFEVVIQLGAIMAVVVLYFGKLNPFSSAKKPEEKRSTWILWGKVLTASVPAAIIGLLFDDKIDALFYNAGTVARMLIIYGVAFIVIEILNKNRQAVTKTLESLTFRTALFIGIFQILALIPGTSRSGATILGAIIIGCSRTVAAEFTFFLAIPVMLGASLLKLVKFGFSFSGTEALILFTGMAAAFAVSILTIRFLLSYIRKNDFRVFGVYRIILGILVLVLFGAGIL